MRESIEARIENQIRKFLVDMDLTHSMSGGTVRKLAKHLGLMFVFNEDEGETWYDLVSMPGNLLLRTHARTACEGQVCCVHNPSDHHMVSWDQEWNIRLHLMQRVCEHDVLHPDPDDLMVRTREPGWPHTWAHTCDGCCDPDN